MKVSTLIVFLALASSAAARIRGNEDQPLETTVTGNIPAIGACADMTQETSSYVNGGELYYKSTVTCYTPASDGSTGKQGHSSHYQNSQHGE